MPLSHDVIYEGFRDASPHQLLNFDISYTGGIMSSDGEYGRHEEFRPHTGQIKFSQRPFKMVCEGLVAVTQPSDGRYKEPLW